MDIIDTIQRIAPEVTELVQRRYLILRAVHFMEPVGRRALARQMNSSERTIRNEIEVLKELDLIQSDSAGMRISEAGYQILEDLKEYIRRAHGLAELERDLTKALGVQQVIVVPGDSDQDQVVKKEMARATARFLRQVLKDGDTLAVTGGTTLSEVATSFPENGKSKAVTVVPARGGLGENVALQANTIAAKLAASLGGQYRLLHAPDDVDAELLDTIASEPRIREVMALGRRAQVLLHGIGTAEEMAKRRGLDEHRLMQLIVDGAVGEAFGYYFDSDGKIVYSTSSIGLRLEDLGKIPMVVAVGGGRSKAYAVLSVLSTGYCDVCITDEGAARRLMNLKKQKGGSLHGC